MKEIKKMWESSESSLYSPDNLPPMVKLVRKRASLKADTMQTTKKWTSLQAITEPLTKQETVTPQKSFRQNAQTALEDLKKSQQLLNKTPEHFTYSNLEPSRIVIVENLKKKFDNSSHQKVIVFLVNLIGGRFNFNLKILIGQ